eukprot:CAMPEP_0194390304 /NCGR_PEP_ID=MMETSP0174-20130528/109209_1 /TAXON_ID=216777 /ORGANISM="Proboscia alata, Strain PI-D3" /LENGTH=147 /DNA_ID=CAMNT_0039183493 /DNA_START=80 /DNA_END=519 /DNA_ORIENTATION=-
MRQNWSDLDLAALEEEWKSGDNKEDFEVTPDEELYQEFERRRKMAFAKVNAATNKANNIPKSHLNRLLIKAQTAGKPEIIMTKLKLDLSPEGKGWKWEALSEFCDDWSYRLDLFTGIKINCYPIVPGDIMVAIQRGWYAEEVNNFLV